MQTRQMSYNSIDLPPPAPYEILDTPLR